jgi:hypothetical protein
MVLSIEQRDGYGRLRLNYLYHPAHSVFERGPYPSNGPPVEPDQKPTIEPEDVAKIARLASPLGALLSLSGDEPAPRPQRGVGGKGWVGDATWRGNVATVRAGGTIRTINGVVPTEEEAIHLIESSGGRVQRIEGPHEPPNPHDFKHINYLSPRGSKASFENRVGWMVKVVQPETSVSIPLFD